MSDFMHWCGNCQIRIYIQRHYGKDLNWQDCPYTCEYATTMRNSNVPSVNVVERKHGKLLTNEFGYESCSVCHYGLMLFITDENNTLRKPNYCPNCGAEVENIDDV